VPDHGLQRARHLERVRQLGERQERGEREPLERDPPRAHTLGKPSFTSRLRLHTLAASGLRAHVKEALSA
jgi:hypothetical protein